MPRTYPRAERNQKGGYTYWRREGDKPRFDPGPEWLDLDKELCFRNLVMTPGYWNAPDVTAAAIKQGWLHTGDAGYRDQDGDVFLTGRYKDMIRRRGENIAPGEVEDALLAHPSVRAAAVFGVPAGLLEDEVVAVVVLRDGVESDEAALKAWAATRLAAFKVPSRIHFRDSLPTTATHRVAKDRLRKEYGHPETD